MATNVEQGYLEEDYLSEDYLSGRVHCAMGVELDVLAAGSLAVELFAYSEGLGSFGVQMKVSNLGYVHCEGMGYLEEDYLEGPYLADCLNVGLGVQLDILTRRGLAVQLTVRQYNTTLMRVMCDIPSRGDGTSWTSNSTMTSSTNSFDVNNVNNDVEERVWRSASAVVTGIQLNCDAGSGNLIEMDTFFMRNHNLTTGATITFLESNDPTFTVVGATTTFTIEEAMEFYYIADDAPLTGYRYGRLNIDDPTNPAGYIQIGVMGYGAAEIMSTTCFALPVEFEPREYADTVSTAAYTNKMNVRATRDTLRLTFNNIIYDSLDWQTFQRILLCAGTTQKALWIPIPETPYRFAVWSKLIRLPRYRHNDLGGNNDYVSFTLEMDEAL